MAVNARGQTAGNADGDNLYLQTGDTTALTINSSQNVGIGKTPNYILDVANTINIDAGYGVRFGAGNAEILSTGSYDLQLKTYDGSSSLVTALTLDSSQNATLNGALTVTDNTGVYIQLTDTTTTPDASWRIYPQTGNTTRLLRFADYNTGFPPRS